MRRDRRKPSSDPRYSCGWHYRKNTFNKERRQFEKMSSFETEAAGLARLGLSGPQHPSTPSRHPGTPRLPGIRPLPSLPTVPGTRAGVPGSAAAYFRVTPRSRQLAPPHRFSKEGGFPCRIGGRKPPGAWPAACVCGMRAGSARAGECVALRLPSGLQRARGPPGRLFPGSQPGPPPS